MIAIDIHRLERDRCPAPFAALSAESRGRKYSQAPDRFRTEFQRDRDRIIHSTAFRRLKHKTQVFADLGRQGDHHRTRLTHTIEVAQISRTIARTLGLNEDLAEAVALAHDLGHTPFGHTGERVLNELTARSGGFNHNEQSLRVVDFLEKRYPDYSGLNLTYELREAIIKHETHEKLVIPEELAPGENPLLEGQIVNYADEIAYFGHDIDDGLSRNILSLEMIRSSEFLGPILEEIEVKLADKAPDMLRYALVRFLVNRMVVDLVEEIDHRLRENAISSVDNVRTSRERLVCFSDSQTTFNQNLRTFLTTYMYRHPLLNEMRSLSEDILRFLYSCFLLNTEEIPAGFRGRYPGQSPERLVCDYIAGMTDRFAEVEFHRLREDNL